MGQAVRMMQYDRAGNVANAVAALEFNGAPLQWHRLDDGVMGGRSETLHASSLDGAEGVHFKGTINTNGGGFTSIRSPINGLPPGTDSIALRFRGDGKTYKVLLSDGGSSGSPFSGSPSWQADLPTSDRMGSGVANMEEARIPLSQFRPSFGPRAVSEDEMKKFKLVPSEMKQVGLMLSLKLSDGSPNPPETFGEGEFDFSLFVESLQPGGASSGEL